MRDMDHLRVAKYALRLGRGEDTVGEDAVGTSGGDLGSAAAGDLGDHVSDRGAWAQRPAVSEYGTAGASESTNDGLAPRRSELRC